LRSSHHLIGIKEFFSLCSSYSDFCKTLFSTNGTYLNWEKLKKNGAAVKVCHGDIISFAAPPQHGMVILNSLQ